MTFKVEYSNQSQKFLKKSNKLVTRRIISKKTKNWRLSCIDRYWFWK